MNVTELLRRLLVKIENIYLFKIIIMIKNMETSLRTGFAQIFSCCPKNLSCPNFGGAAAPLASPARTTMPSSNCKKLLRQICRFVELLKYSKLIWTFCKEKLKRYKIFSTGYRKKQRKWLGLLGHQPQSRKESRVWKVSLVEV